MRTPLIARTVKTATLFSLFMLLPTFTTDVRAVDWTVIQLGGTGGSFPEIDGYKVAWVDSGGALNVEVHSAYSPEFGMVRMGPTGTTTPTVRVLPVCIPCTSIFGR